MYKTPNSIIYISQHKWAWGLQERMQETHAAEVIYTDRIRLQFPQKLYDEAEDKHSLSENKYMPLDAESFDETKLESPADFNDQDVKYSVTDNKEIPE